METTADTYSLLINRGKRLLLILFPVFLMAACSTTDSLPDLGTIYNDLARQESPDRNPIIVIPGLLGSKLVDTHSKKIIWGAFGTGQINPKTLQGARLISLPMKEGKTLQDLSDSVVSDGALESLELNLFGIPIEHHAYYNILRVLGIGGYRDQSLSEAGGIDYGDRHFTCFQFDYDWRRDITESARALDSFIKEKHAYVQKEIENRFGIKNHPVKFDIVAHSMGGLVARYYLRYGAQPLPIDGRPPDITWAGAHYVDSLVMIGTPNAGSLDALTTLVNGNRPSLLLPFYPAAVLGTMPSMYQLLPRNRHYPLLDAAGQPVADLFDPLLWKKNAWGLADPEQDQILEKLIADQNTLEGRQRVAFDHLKKSLSLARQFTDAMDRPAPAPDSLDILLFAGDAAETAKTLRMDSANRPAVFKTGPGDGTVLRSSALLDEHSPDTIKTRLSSPISWRRVHFVFSDHLGITDDPSFIDNLLYFLLERPHDKKGG